MPNPISTLPNPKADRTDPELEVDELLGDDASATRLDTDPIESDDDLEVVRLSTGFGADPTRDGIDTEDSAAPPKQESKARYGLIALVLGVFLLGSFAINLKQSRDVASLEIQNAEFEQALGAAVARIDSETARANGAEAALGRVDNAVDVVNERILGLQEALDGLRAATTR